MSRELRSIVTATSIVWLVAFASGIFLFFGYRPTAAAAYADMETLRSTVTIGIIARRVHRWTSVLALLLPVVGLIVALVHHGSRRAVPWAASVLLTVATIVTGTVLPWNQISLWAATTGRNVWEFTPVLGDQVRFVLINGLEVNGNQISRWVLIHAILLPVATALPVVISAVRSRGRETAAEIETVGSLS